MALKSKKDNNFKIKVKNSSSEGENIVFFKGGATVVEGTWVYLNDLRLNVEEVVLKYINQVSRRVFNHVNSILYVLIVRTETGTIEVLPSASFNKKSYGDVKVFPDLSNKVPLVLVKLTQDGSSGLTGINPIKKEDLEVYKGQGNYTLKGAKGDEGYKGFTGYQGITGLQGIEGYLGDTGIQGATGLQGISIQGVTGVEGLDGEYIPRYIPDRYI